MPRRGGDHHAIELAGEVPSLRLRPITLLALLLAGCSSGGDCLPPSGSPAREAFRERLRGLVHVSQCVGPTTPRALVEQESQAMRREHRLLARIRNSPLAEDLVRATREDEEWSRNAGEADCVAYDWDNPDSPANFAEVRSRLDRWRLQLDEVEADLVRLTAGCSAD